jgi:DNA-binding NarL/FixJ family response regulator
MKQDGEAERRAIRLLIADAHKFAVLGIQKALEGEADIEVIGAAADGEEAVRMVVDQEPDVVIVDAELPKLSGLKATQRIKRELPHVGVVVMTDSEDEQTLFEAIKAGASAYLSKNAEPAELVDTLRRVRAGQFTINEKVFSRPAVASKVLAEFRELSVYGPSSAHVFAPLSPREVQILDNIAQGMTNKEVAYALAISEQTVKNHMSSILRKLSVNDRTQAVVYAIRQGWIRGPEGS